MNSTAKTLVFWLVIAVSAFLLWQTVKGGQNKQPETPEISYSEFLSQVEAGNVAKVSISKTQVNGSYRDGRSFRLTGPTSQEGMLQTLHQKSVEIRFTDAAEGNWSGAWLSNIAPLILLAVLWLFMIRQMKQRQAQPPANRPT